MLTPWALGQNKHDVNILYQLQEGGPEREYRNGTVPAVVVCV